MAEARFEPSRQAPKSEQGSPNKGSLPEDAGQEWTVAGIWMSRCESCCN